MPASCTNWLLCYQAEKFFKPEPFIPPIHINFYSLPYLPSFFSTASFLFNHFGMGSG